MTLDEIDAEIMKCRVNPAYFIHTYCKIHDADTGSDVPFHLWPDQAAASREFRIHRLVLLLKARQVGMTTLVLADAVHVAIFEPGATILLFSKGQSEARDLISRIKAMIRALPDWLQPAEFLTDATQILKLSNRSRYISFASRSSGGDSYTATLVIIDEADLIKDLDLVLSGAKPTIDAGARLVMLSRTDKTKEDSPFKRICRRAIDPNKKSQYKLIFFPWWARPGRTREWYEEVKAEILDRTGSLDELYANYPETPQQSLAARMTDKRFPIEWLEKCFVEQKPLTLRRGHPFAGWHGLEIYVLPVPGREYVIGTDVAKGNPNSDDSVSVVLDKLTLEECAVLCGKYEPTVLATNTAKLAEWYNGAKIEVERNNHGHKCIEKLKKLRAHILRGRDGKPGWWTDQLGKTMMYDTTAEVLRLGACVIHSQATLDQLGSLDVGSLEAPAEKYDDRAVAFALAVQGAAKPMKKGDLIIVSAEEPAAPPPSASKHQFIAYMPTFNSWEAWVEHEGRRIALGDYAEADVAAGVVNCALVTLGMDPVNAAPVIDAELIARIELKLKARR